MDIKVNSHRTSKHHDWVVDPFKIETWGGSGWAEVVRIFAEVTQDGEIYVRIYGYQMLKDGSRRRSNAAYGRVTEKNFDIETWVEERV